MCALPSPDAVTDYVELLQSQRAALADARRLSDELAAVNAELDRRVAERTEQVERAHEALKRTTADHERSLTKLAQTNHQLQQEMTTRARVESELRLAHRLEAVGQLADGIGHEVNTSIQYVADSIFSSAMRSRTSSRCSSSCATRPLRTRSRRSRMRGTPPTRPSSSSKYRRRSSG